MTPLPLREVFAVLRATVPTGPWWPASSDFEIVVGAVLTQNVAWTNVERALANLAAADVFTPQALSAVQDDQLATLIRPAGYMNTKAKYLKAVSRWFLARHHEVAADPALPTEQLRAELLGVRGVGPETADDILLYVYHRPVFIWDVYARRLLAAVGYPVKTDYEATRRALSPAVEQADFSVAELQRFHGLIVDAGKVARLEGGWEALWPKLCSQL